MRERRKARSWILDKCGVFFPSLFFPALTYWPPLDHGRYKASDILLLTDDSKDPRSLPTRDNLIQAMKWLVRGAKKDDSLFFHCEQSRSHIHSSSLSFLPFFWYIHCTRFMFLYFLGVATLGTYLDLVLNPCDCTPRPSVKYASYLITDHVYWPALLFFNIDSGHGGQTPDLDGDEVDGLDEGRSPFTRFCLLLSHTMFRDERTKCTPSGTVLGCMIHRIFSRSFFFSFVHSRTLFVTTALSKIGEFMTVVASFFADKWFPLFFSDLPTRLPDQRSHRWWCGWFFLFTKLSQAPWYFCLFHFIGNACDYGENFTFGMSSYGEIDRLCCFHAISSCTIFFFFVVGWQAVFDVWLTSPMAYFIETTALTLQLSVLFIGMSLRNRAWCAQFFKFLPRNLDLRFSFFLSIS